MYTLAYLLVAVGIAGGIVYMCETVYKLLKAIRDKSE